MKKLLRSMVDAHWMFIVIALVFGLALMVITPPLWGADEGVHFFRAYQLSNGEISQKQVSIDGKSSNAGSVPASFVRLNDIKAKGIADSALGGKQAGNIGAYYSAARIPITKDKSVANPYTKTIYSPIVYIAPAAGIYIIHFFNPTAITMLFSARIATLSLYILLVFLALYILITTVVKWTIFIIALLSMLLYQATVVSPDSLLLGLSLIFLAILYVTLYAKHRLGRKEIVLITLTTCLITLIKMPYVILTLPRSEEHTSELQSRQYL